MDSVVLEHLEIGGFGPTADPWPIDVFGDRVFVFQVDDRSAEERLPADHVDGDAFGDCQLTSLFDVGAVVARFVGDENDEQPPVLGDQVAVAGNHGLDGVEDVFISGVVDSQVVDRLADLVDVRSRLGEDEVNVLAEADDDVLECIR